jgi:hypothetical protein
MTKRIIQFLFCVLIAALGSRAQTPAPAEQAKPASGTSNDRIFYALPNFLTLENADHVPPLSVGEKFKVTARSSFDPVTFVWHGLQAGISQANNSEPAYGQGAEGYAKRFAQNFADGTIENFTTQAIFPSILHQDPRYFQSGPRRSQTANSLCRGTYLCDPLRFRAIASQLFRVPRQFHCGRDLDLFLSPERRSESVDRCERLGVRGWV